MAKPKTNPTNTYLGFRPKIENEADFNTFRRWCEAHRTTYSAVFNALIPKLKQATQDTTEVHAGTLTVDFSFGRLAIPMIQNPKQN